MRADIVRHRRGRAGEIRPPRRLRAGIPDGRARRRPDGPRAIRATSAAREALMHFAMAGPGDDLDVGLGGDVLREIFVRQHDDARHAERFDDLARIARGAADVGFRLHRGRGVDIGDDRHAGIALAQQPHVLGRDRVGERTAGAHVRDQHGLLRIEQLRRLGHEMDAGEHDDIGLDLGRLAGERQAVADDVGDAVEDLRRLVIMRQDHRVARLLQRRGSRRCRRRRPAIRRAESHAGPWS